MLSSDILHLTIDGIPQSIRSGETLLEALRRLPISDDKTLTTRPLAAQIGGMVYDLNYSPSRSCDIRLLRYGSEAGRRVYERSLQFILLTAIRRVMGDVRVVERYSLGRGVYITVEDGETLTQALLDRISDECRAIIADDLPFVHSVMSTDQAVEYFKKEGREDMVQLLSFRKCGYFNTYTIDGSTHADYFYGKMLPSTGYVSVFDLVLQDGAIIMLMPKSTDPSVPETYTHPPKLAECFERSDSWDDLMRCANVTELNRHVQSGSIGELIRVNEALHERSFAQMADSIAQSGARAIMVAGPSSSGKTTSANRLATQLRTIGLEPIMLSLDNYYLDRDAIPSDENGEVDLEHINTLDTELFSHNLAELLHKGETLSPVFNFKTGKREAELVPIRVGSDNPIIVEGIHGLNPSMLTGEVDDRDVFRVYVSALTTLNLDDHNRIRTADVRLLRRLVRDFRDRNASMEHTLAMWQSVRRGEETWIFPYQEHADVIFNTTLVYEIALLKRYVYPLLKSISPESPFYTDARELVKFLNYFDEADPKTEREIPPTSILREFIGDNVFYG